MNLETTLERKILYSLLVHFTKVGVLLFFSLILTTLAACISLDVPEYYLFAGLFFTFFVSLIYQFTHRRKVEVSREKKITASAGTVCTLNFRVKNSSKKGIFDLYLEFFHLPDQLEQQPADRTPYLAGGETAGLQLRLLPRKRGIYQMVRLAAYTTYPFNLMRAFCGESILESLIVLPSFKSLRGLSIPSGKKYQPGGVMLTSSVGESPEYIGNREYRPGDSTRRIDFRAWARLQKPVVRDYMEEFFSRVALVLDTYLPGKKKIQPDGNPAFEAAVSLVAAISEVLFREEYLVDFFAAGPDLYVFRAGRNLAHLDNMLEILACINETRTNPFDTLLPRLSEELKGVSSLIFVFLAWDDERRKLVRAALESGCAVRVFVVGEAHFAGYLTGLEGAGEITMLSPEQVGNLDLI
ncbi:MAG: DUF58 domain-containing protein [Candidatus Wallbacteria bacterium]|nr:DUF58 domain-containing protein [Candidatus Wallbacteria bacterium]